MNKKILIGGGLFALGAILLSNSTSTPSKPTSKPMNPAAPNSIPGTALWVWNGRVSLSRNIPQQEWFGTTAENDYGGHGSEIFQYVLYENEVRQGQPQMRTGKGSYAWLYNNPGNIMGPQPNYGQYPGKFGWHNFMVFPNFQTGFDAIALYLATPRYAPLTITQAFNVYAPAKDGGNKPDQYAQEVANAAGISTLTKIRDLTSVQLRLVQEKIVQIEGTVPGSILTYDQFKQLVPNTGIV